MQSQFKTRQIFAAIVQVVCLNFPLMSLFLHIRYQNINKEEVSPCQWTWLLSRCRSNRGSMQQPDIWPGPNLKSQYLQCRRKFSALFSWSAQRHAGQVQIIIINKQIEKQENDDYMKKAGELGGNECCSRTRTDKQLRKALTPRTQWWERWHSHGDGWNYSPAELLYKNLEWSRGGNRTFSLAKDSGLSLRFLSYTRQSEKMFWLKVRRKFSAWAELECLWWDVLIVYPTCVPGVVAGCPGQIPGETVGQVEDGPG